MVAKNKGDFLFQLHNELHRIGVDADTEIFADFEEHFKASANEGLSEEETCAKLGDVKEIARNYIDIDSEHLNSIVATAIEADRPHISLTKPGESIPADISLSKRVDAEPEQSETSEPIREYVSEHILPEQPSEDTPIREYSPEHITLEQSAPKSEAPNIRLNKETADTQPEASPVNISGAFGSTGSFGTADASAKVADSTATGDDKTELQSAMDDIASGLKDAFKGVKQGVKIGIDAAVEGINNASCEMIKSAEESKNDPNWNWNNGSAASTTAQREYTPDHQQPESVPTPSDDHSQNNTSGHTAEYPKGTPWEKKKFVDKKTGLGWQDIKGRSVNVDVGRLIGMICLDLFVFSWCLPALASVICAFIGTFVFGIFAAGIAMLKGVGGFHILSCIFLSGAHFSLAVLMGCIGVKMVKGFIHIIMKVVFAHVKAIYSL